MKILSIGNSFSQDAHQWLHQLAKQQGFEIETVNLYIGGCDLETHWNNAVNNNAFYDLEKNGNQTGEKISILQAIKLENWDVITLQQASHFSGIPETYKPYLKNLSSYIRELCPFTKILFHQTWAYETDSDHGGFVSYESNQKIMFDKITATATQMADSINAEIIPVGKVIQHIRENLPEFDYQNGALSLCRDGFHLSLDYGRYAAAATWLRVLTGVPVLAIPFMDFDFEKTSKIIDAVNSVCN
ncbi:MAG: DUF4886 domain-containing protein [Ruminococcaceae bacterium]|nr:DUF4886 domain-containing protein [Oscillospiraceae bacterium]